MAYFTRKTYGAFLLANRFYWFPNVTFSEAGCSVVKGAYDTGLDVDVFIEAFAVVGLELVMCPFARE